MSRALATIRAVTKTIPIEGADFIELVIVDGWQCIVKKGEFEKGSLGVYFEIDSVLPDQKKYEFLKKMTNTRGGMGYRIKTMKMRKQLSQGLMLPLSSFAEELKSSVSVGDDVTEALGVWLYEPILRNGPMSNTECLSIGKKVFPDFLRKTDQERIQNKMHYFETYKDHIWEATKKLDGSSMTVWNYSKAQHMPKGVMNRKWKTKILRVWDNFLNLFKTPVTFGVCSRNVNLRNKEGNAFWDMANSIDFKGILAGQNMALQGELIGPSIQKNHEKVERNEFYLFDIFDIDRQEYLLPSERLTWLLLHDPFQSIKVVPFIKNIKVFTDYTNVEEIQELVTGPSINPGTISEGMVFKSTTDRGLSFKCISNKFLLRFDD